MQASAQRARGILIAVEGIDGSGKSTQVRLLAEALESLGEAVVTSKEPTEGPWGRKVRRSATSGRLSLDEELTAFVNDRKEHVRDVIQPALDAGKIVVLDRYFYSTIAYQGSRGKDIAELQRAMEALAPIPDVVFLLDVSPQVSIARISTSRNEKPNEFETLENLTRVRQAFHAIADPRIIKIDGTLPERQVHDLMMSNLKRGPLRLRRSLGGGHQRSAVHPN